MKGLGSAVWMMVVLGVAVPCSAQSPKEILMKDAGQFVVDTYCGNRAVHEFVPGHKLQTALTGMLVFDSQGNGYVASGTFIAIVTPEGRADVLTGHTDLAGNTDGPPGRAAFGNALDIARVNDDLMYVADAANFTLRRLTRKDGVWHTDTVAGVPGRQGRRDGPGRQALLQTVFDSVVADEDGVVYMFSGDWLRKYENGVVTTLNPDGGSGYVNGPLRRARFLHSQGRMRGLALDGEGNLYVADKVNVAIRKVDLKRGEVTTLAGRMPDEPKDAPRDGPALDARFHPGGGPTTLAYDRQRRRFYIHVDDERYTRVLFQDKDGWFVNTLAAPWAPPGQEPTVRPFGGLPAGMDHAGNFYLWSAGRILRLRTQDTAKD